MIWLHTEENTTSGAAICGESIHTQKDMAMRAKAKPVSPCTKPATIAPTINNSQVIGEGHKERQQYSKDQ